MSRDSDMSGGEVRGTNVSSDRLGNGTTLPYTILCSIPYATQGKRDSTGWVADIVEGGGLTSVVLTLVATKARIATEQRCEVMFFWLNSTMLCTALHINFKKWRSHE